MNFYFVSTEYQEFDSFVEALTPEKAIELWRAYWQHHPTRVPTQVYQIKLQGEPGVLPWKEVFNRYSLLSKLKLAKPPVTEGE